LPTGRKKRERLETFMFEFNRKESKFLIYFLLLLPLSRLCFYLKSLFCFGSLSIIEWNLEEENLKFLIPCRIFKDKTTTIKVKMIKINKSLIDP
jgi:hypothetical protein